MVYALLLAIAATDGPASMTEEELKKYFWICETTSREIMLDDSDAAACSVVFETLKARVFKGDANALFDWWRAERDQKHDKRTD